MLLGLALCLWALHIGPGLEQSPPNRAALLGLVSLCFVLALALWWLLHRLARLTRQAGQRDEEHLRALNFRARFLGSVSHQLRTPLNGIMAMSELITHGMPGDDQREVAMVIHSSALQLESMVGSLLAMASLECGQEQLRVAAVQLGDIVKQIRTVHSMHAESCGLHFHVWTGEDPGQIVYVDRTKLLQVVHCLTDNSLRFTKKGSVIVKLELTRQGDLMVRISDSGCGIARASPTQTVAEGGVGAAGADATTDPDIIQGLELAMGLVRLMSGTIQIHSVADQGTSVRIQIPQLGSDQ